MRLKRRVLKALFEVKSLGAIEDMHEKVRHYKRITNRYRKVYGFDFNVNRYLECSR